MTSLQDNYTPIYLGAPEVLYDLINSLPINIGGRVVNSWSKSSVDLLRTSNLGFFCGRFVSMTKGVPLPVFKAFVGVEVEHDSGYGFITDFRGLTPKVKRWEKHFPRGETSCLLTAAFEHSAKVMPLFAPPEYSKYFANFIEHARQ
jgi:hypothetical protein